MSSPMPSQTVPQPMPTKACIRCSDRKVKCDRKIPCNSCVRHNVQCIYRPPKPSRKERRFVRDRLVDERMKRYESFLKTNGFDPEQVAGGSAVVKPTSESETSETATETLWQMAMSPSSSSGPQETVFQAQLLHGQRGTKLVDNSLWSRVAEEMHDGDDAHEDESGSEVGDGGAVDDDFVYVLGWTLPNIASWHPSAQAIHQLWETFTENVDLLYKLVHVPTLQTAIVKAAANIEHVPKGFEALMFAIYSTAVLSLTASECQKRMGEPRTVLLRRYVTATKAALSRAKFMSSTSIVVLQALILHIFSIRNSDDPRAVWTLTGAALRISDGMGIHIDGTLLGLPPFETEIRRRLYWNLRMHDFRAAELAGQSKFRDLEIKETTPKRPANVNDCDLYPGMAEPPVESTKPTEMTWSVFRADLATFAASQKVRLQFQGNKPMTSSDDFAAMDDMAAKDGSIAIMEDMIETKYLRYCDPSQPIQLLTLLAGRSAANTVRFMAHHPRRWAKMKQVLPSEEQLVWDTATQLIEQYNVIQSNPLVARFAWSAPYFIQWQAVIHVLDTLRADPHHVGAAKAWKLIDTLYENNAEIMLNSNRPIYISVGNLCLKAFNARESALTKDSVGASDTPDYVIKLREQREAARARREIANAKSKHEETLDGVRKLTTDDTTNQGWSNVNGMATHAPAHTQAPPFYSIRVQPAQTTGDDAFWLSTSRIIDFSTIGTSDMMDLDADAILTQDSWLEGSGNEAIDWSQWDAWLGNMNSSLNVTAEQGPIVGGT